MTSLSCIGEFVHFGKFNELGDFLSIPLPLNPSNASLVQPPVSFFLGREEKQGNECGVISVCNSYGNELFVSRILLESIFTLNYRNNDLHSTQEIRCWES